MMLMPIIAVTAMASAATATPVRLRESPRRPTQRAGGDAQTRDRASVRRRTVEHGQALPRHAEHGEHQCGKTANTLRSVLTTKLRAGERQQHTQAEHA